MEVGMVCPVPGALVGVRNSTPISFSSCFGLLEVEVSEEGGTLSVSGESVVPPAGHDPDDRGGELEGGGVSAHAAHARRSLRVASRRGNSLASNSAGSGQVNQAAQASEHRERGLHPNLVHAASSVSSSSVPATQPALRQDRPPRGADVHTGPSHTRAPERQNERAEDRGQRAAHCRHTPGTPTNEEHVPAFFTRKRENHQKNNPLIRRNT
ncbi:hypothetical protein DFH09DRAFT_1085802 [Mycena vulgaris]|nr:hypothetical protein DFH09DRAFT_1085802 [Mycena vulgaris]